jgi:hypothetical protein
MTVRLGLCHIKGKRQVVLEEGVHMEMFGRQKEEVIGVCRKDSA